MNQSQNKPTVAFLMGPTACGKTDLAIYLHQNFPVDIISVDSALIYRGMDIGTAKPTAQELAQAPHRLIDIRDPAETYSVAQFCQDVQREVESIVAQGRVPLLVGGTMMYYKSLLEGLADMPATDPCIREQIAQEAQQKGWPAMHQQLMQVDPSYGQKIHPNHSQRIGRALEVYRSSGKTMSQCLEAQAAENDFVQQYRIKQFALLPDERSWLHERIKKRYLMMLEQGFVDEVAQLKQRGDLHLDLPSMRCVGYRQVWQYLENEFSYEEMVDKGMAATRQLAKRQLTWLRSWSDLLKLSAGAAQNKKIISEALNF